MRAQLDPGCLGFRPDRAEAAPEQPAGLCRGDLEGRFLLPVEGGARGPSPSGDRRALLFLSEEWGVLS